MSEDDTQLTSTKPTARTRLAATVRNAIAEAPHPGGEFAVAVLAAAVVNPVTWVVAAPMFVGFIAAVRSGTRARAAEEAIEQLAQGDQEIARKLVGLEGIAADLASGQALSEIRLDDMAAQLEGLDIRVRDVRQAATTYAEALAADDEESARAYARAAARAIAGRNRDQATASALQALGGLTGDGRRALLDLGAAWAEKSRGRLAAERSRLRTQKLPPGHDMGDPVLQGLVSLGLITSTFGTNGMSPTLFYMSPVGEALLELIADH